MPLGNFSSHMVILVTYIFKDSGDYKLRAEVIKTILSNIKSRNQ
jgi:hypothetical protein